MTNFLIGIILGGLFFWDASVWTIGKECERLGGFYYRNQVYECKASPKDKSHITNTNQRETKMIMTHDEFEALPLDVQDALKRGKNEV